MDNCLTICIPPLSEVCAIVGARKQDVLDRFSKSNSGYVCSDNSALPCELLSVITANKIVHDFKRSVDLNISSSISWSVLKNLPMFCFPFDTQFSYSQPEITVEYGIYTDEQGSRLYMYCLCFPVGYRIPEPNPDFQKSEIAYSITKMCFFSSHKCFMLMKDILQILSLYVKDSKSLNKEVQDLLTVLSNVFVPPKGTLDVGFEYKDRSFTVQCQTIAGLCDIPWALPFMYFDHKAIIEIITAIISEQQIVFVSDNQATRVLMIECFLSYIFPLEWLAPYFPVLTENLYGMLDALGYFIFGADRSVLEEAQDQKYIIFVDIDKGSISYCEEAVHYHVEPYVVAKMKEKLPGTSFSFLGSSINKIYANEKEMLMARDEFDRLLNARIFLSMQYLLLDLYEGLLMFQMSAKMQLSKKRNAGYVACTLSPFQQHLKKTMMRSNLRLKFNNPYLERQYFSKLESLKIMPIDQALDVYITLKRSNECITFCHSVDTNLKTVEQKLTTSKSASNKSSLLYLRALLFLKKNEPIMAFQSIYKIFEAGVKDFPAAEAMTLLNNLEREPDIYNKVMGQAFMKQAVWAPLSSELGPVTIRTSYLSKQSTYNYLEFPEIMVQIGVTRNYAIAHKIFSALKSDSGFVLGQDLNNFCDIWKEIKLNLDRKHLPMIANNKEKIVKISEQSNKTGTSIYLVSSIYKLYFVDSVTDQICDFINLDEITDIQVRTSDSVVKFKLNSRHPKSIENIKDAFVWWMVLEELIGATNSFKKTKDHNALVDARAGILIFDALNQYDTKYGEMVQLTEIVETDGASSNFYISKSKPKHSGFLAFREELGMAYALKPIISATSSAFGIGNVLCRFSPNTRIKETVDVLIARPDYMFVGTKLCNLYKVSMSTFEVEDHISLMLTNSEKWTLYDILQIDDNLWVAVKYKASSRSLHIINCHSFDNYQTLTLNHNDHIVGMRKDKEYCYISSMDGLTSIWSIKAKHVTQCVQNGGYFVFSTYMNSNVLLQSVKDGFSALNKQEFVFHETGFTLTKFIVCNQHIFGIDKATPNVIRCFSLSTFVHLKDYDISNTFDKSDKSSFYNLIKHNDTHLLLATRECSLLVYNLSDRCFEKVVRDAHSDCISSMVTTEDEKVITGSRSMDGTVAVWIDMFN